MMIIILKNTLISVTLTTKVVKADAAAYEYISSLGPERLVMVA